MFIIINLYIVNPIDFIFLTLRLSMILPSRPEDFYCSGVSGSSSSLSFFYLLWRSVIIWLSLMIFSLQKASAILVPEHSLREQVMSVPSWLMVQLLHPSNHTLQLVKASAYFDLTGV